MYVCHVHIKNMYVVVHGTYYVATYTFIHVPHVEDSSCITSNEVLFWRSGLVGTLRK
jgi:hypothetical protein